MATNFSREYIYGALITLGKIVRAIPLKILEGGGNFP